MTPEERKEKKRKIRNKMDEILKREDLVSGIYNYCDRWCERCTFTSKCMNFLMDQDMNNECNDISNKEFWEELSLQFEICADMIKENFPDFDFDNSDEPVKMKKEKKSEAEIKAREYGLNVHKWFEENKEFVNQKAESMASVSQEKVLSMIDAVEVINWYRFFIPGKVFRATRKENEDYSDMDDELKQTIEEANSYDSLGSAKIALIAIERSLQAFSFLYTHMPEKEDDVLNFLSDLSVIKRKLSKAVPGAVDFKRPGFDD